MIRISLAILIVVMALIVSLRAIFLARNDGFQHGSYPIKKQNTKIDQLIKILFIFSMIMGLFVYQIKNRATSIIVLPAAVYCYISARHFQLTKNSKPFFFACFTLIIVVLFSLYLWNAKSLYL